MNLYEQYREVELIQPVEHLIDGGKLFFRNSKLYVNYQLQKSSPWVVVKIDPTRKCHFFLEIINQCYGFVHSRCHNCYKVVVRPKTLSQLMNLLKIEERLNVYSKCGVEVRPFVSGLYGGYFYADSVEEGKERYRQIRKLVNENLSEKVAVILKRGCTEYEMQYGRSDKWLSPNDSQKLKEVKIDEMYVVENHDLPMPDYLKAKTILGWIEFAFEHGDETYKQFTDGQCLGLLPVTYHDNGKEVL